MSSKTISAAEMFARIDQWEHDEIMAASAHNAADAASVNRTIAIKRKFNEMRTNAMRMIYNAEQFNRRSAWMRKTNRNADEAMAMFPVSST